MYSRVAAASISISEICILTRSPMETRPTSRPVSTTGMWRNRRVVISDIIRHQLVDRVGLPRRDHTLGHEVRDGLLQDFGTPLADRPHEIALRHDARDLVVVSHDDDAANATLPKQRCDIASGTAVSRPR